MDAGKKQMIQRYERWKDGEILRWKDLGCIWTSSMDASTVTQRASEGKEKSIDICFLIHTTNPSHC